MKNNQEKPWWREEADRILLRQSEDGIDDLCAIGRLILDAEERAVKKERERVKTIIEKHSQESNHIITSVPNTCYKILSALSPKDAKEA